jgi:diguanylate cyclase (GGDEF)-like protein/PAS domain S-box-containing protein
MSSFPSQADRFLEHYLARHQAPEALSASFPVSYSWALCLGAAVLTLLCLAIGLAEAAVLIWGGVFTLATIKRLAWQAFSACALATLAGCLVWYVIDPRPFDVNRVSVVVCGLVICVSYLLGQVVRLKATVRRQHINNHLLVQFSTALTQAPDVCLKELDLEGRLLSMNETGKRLMDACNFDSVHGTAWLSLWTEEWSAQAQQAFDQACLGLPGRFSGVCETLKGNPKWWDVLILPVRGLDGQVESLLTFSWDMTEAQQTAINLKQAHDEFDALLNTLNEGMYTLDQNWRFTQVNDMAQEVLKRSREELVGSYIWDLYPDEVERELGAAYRDVMYSGFPRHFEFYFRPFQQWHRVSAYPRPNGITVFFSNITSDVASVQQSQASETRLRLAQEIGRFADWQFELSTRELMLSEQAMQLLGISMESGSSHQDELMKHLHPDDRLGLVSALLDLTEGKPSLNVSARLKNTEQSGAWRDFQFAGVVLRPKAHPQGLLVGCMQDVSIQKHREQRLIQAEAFTRSILDALPQLVCVLNEAGTVITVNQAWNRFIDTAPSQWKWPESGSNYLKFCTAMAERGEAMAQTTLAKLQALLDGSGDPFSLEFKVELGGDIRVFHLFALLMDTEQKQILIVHDDVTETARLQRAINTQTQRLKLIYEGANDGLWEWIPQRKALYLSERFIELTGDAIGEEQPFSQWLVDHAHPEDVERLAFALEQHLISDKPLDIELRLQTPRGWHWFRVRGKAEREGDTLVRFAGSLMDISFQKALLAQLQESEARFREMVEFLPHVFWVYDIARGQISYVSPAFQNIWGCSPELLYNDMSSWIRLVHQDDKALVERFHDEVISHHRPAEVEYRSADAHGQLLWIRNKAFPFLNVQGEVARIVGIAEDITEARTYQEQLFTAAHFDSLSGLPNQVMFHKRLEEQCVQAAKGNREFLVLFIGLDRIKWVQQCLGQRLRDTVVHQVSERFQAVLGTKGYLASLANDEFAVLLSREDEVAHVQAVINGLLHSLEQHFPLGTESIRLTGCIGVAQYPMDGETAEQLVKNANAAVYAVQKSGRSGYQFFNQGLLKHSFDTLKLEAELNRAIEQNEFVLYYQPKVNVADQQVCGAEALIRWEHPAHGLISPLRFISLLEETGLIVPVGLWCIDQALAQLARWQSQGVRHFVMAVNLSLRQLQPDLCEQVRQSLEHHGVKPGCLELELTESIMPEPGSETSNIINDLKALGVRIAVDDFGTGYSTLGSLRSFVPDTLKIDRSFLNEVVSSASDRTIVKSVIEMAHALSMTVVAEGVESPEQQRLLEALHCDQMQGFLISPPVVAAVFEEKHIAIK